jgi:hypothetical protein
MFEMVQMGFWIVLPYSAVRHQTQLKLAPLGVVPQRDRRPRPIMDYTFNGVNQHPYRSLPSTQCNLEPPSNDFFNGLPTAIDALAPFAWQK